MSILAPPSGRFSNYRLGTRVPVSYFDLKRNASAGIKKTAPSARNERGLGFRSAEGRLEIVTDKLVGFGLVGLLRVVSDMDEMVESDTTLAAVFPHLE